MNIVRATFTFAKRNLPPMFKPIQAGPKVKQSNEFKEVKQLFKEMTSEDSIKEAIQENYSPKQILKQINIEFDQYFLKRPYNIESFNFLLSAIITQDKYDQFIETLELMTKMKIRKNLQTYHKLIQGYAKFKKIKQSEYYFNIAKKKFGDSIQLYNTMADAYCKSYMPQQAYSIFKELNHIGIEPDVQMYTTLINAFYRGKQYDKCWELFDDVRIGKSSNPPDENLLGLMIEICAVTHDAEKAIDIYDDLMDGMEFKESTIVFNCLIKALGSRPDYADKALEYFQLMQMKRIPIDQDTIVSTLKACASAGDVKTAYDVIRLMKENKIEESQYIFNQIIRVYSGACKLENLDIDIRNQYVEDAWKVFHEAEAKNKVTQWTLNSMCQVMVNAERLADLEGLVLPLFDQYKFEKNPTTYEQILHMLHKEKRILDVFKLFEDIETKFTPTFNSICYYIENAILAADEEKVIKALEWFNKIKRMPKNKYLVQLGNVENLPLRIHALLDEYSNKFGLVKSKIYKSQKSDNYYKYQI